MLAYQGMFQKLLLQNDYEKSKERALYYTMIFLDRIIFIWNCKVNGIEEQNLVNQNLIKISQETGIPLIATNDAHYLKQEDAKAHEILLCIQTGKNMNDENRMRFSTDELYIKSQRRCSEAFS